MRWLGLHCLTIFDQIPKQLQAGLSQGCSVDQKVYAKVMCIRPSPRFCSPPLSTTTA